MINKSLFFSIENPPQGATHYDGNQFFRIGFRARTYRWTSFEWVRSSKELCPSMELKVQLDHKTAESMRLKEQSKKMIDRPRTPKPKIQASG